MAGTVVADTIQNGAGTSTSMTNAITGSAKAWVQYNGVAQTISSSFNVSSVTYNSAGNYTINMTTAMPTNTYAIGASVGGPGAGRASVINTMLDNAGNYVAPTTTSFRLNNYAGGQYNDEFVSAIVFSN